MKIVCVCIREYYIGNTKVFTEGKKYNIEILGPRGARKENIYRLQDDLGSERSYTAFEDYFKTIDEVRNEILIELGI